MGPDKFQGFRDVIVNCSGGDTKFSGNFLVRFSLLPAFQENGALPFREFGNNLLELLQSGMVIDQFFGIAGGIGILELLHPYKLLQVDSSPETVADFVVGDGEKVGFEGRFFAEGFVVFPYLEKDRLNQLFRFSF